MSRPAAIAALLLLVGCGVKAPPRPPLQPNANPGGEAAPAPGTRP